ncbi:matrixin family metalloprotease [Levilactobacillus brevis]|uniref:matrixin family metalloprotease n=1 Tax=Levilactobacillus brevis TaxID=1580 RepID=UPI000B3FBC6E|nr:matrixin family metalloprotease [Levilactobacillus brevis]
MIKNWYRGSLIAVVTILLMVTQLGGSSASASSTPFGPERFSTDHATYTISAQSPYYRRIWQEAIKAWNETGAFHFRKADSASAAQVTLKVASKHEAAALGEDVGLTEYTAKNSYLQRATATLNPTLLHEYNYSRANQLAVAGHELGHVMGLAHNPDKQSVMYYRNRKVGIQPVDIQGVKLRYQTPAGQASN